MDIKQLIKRNGPMCTTTLDRL